MVYFVSKEYLGNKIILKPRVPLNFLTENGFEDNITPRVCASTSIDGCLTGLSMNLKDTRLFVYRSEEENFYIPNDVQVPDVELTGEVWFLEPVEWRYYREILVKDALESDERLLYKYGDNVAEVYRWEYI